jgi:hypothetical protein
MNIRPWPLMMRKVMNKTILFLLLFLTSCIPNPVVDVEGEKKNLQFDPTEKDFARKSPRAGRSSAPEVKKVFFLENAQAFNLRFGDRKYINSVLREIFGEDEECTQASTKLIWENFDTFGGLCDFYNAHDYPSEFNDTLDCQDSDYNFVYPPESGNMHAARINVCEDITKNKVCLENSIKGDAFSIDDPDSLTLENIKKQYELFYTFQDPPSKELLDQLLKLDETGTPKDRWHSIMLALCLSPAWQIP